MNDAARAVPAFAREFEIAGGVAIESDAELVEQQLFHGGRTLAHELIDSGGIRGAVAGVENVARELTGVRRGVVNDAALRPVAIGDERTLEREELDREPGLGRMQRIRRAR